MPKSNPLPDLPINSSVGRIALVWRGNPEAPNTVEETSARVRTILSGVFEVFAQRGIEAESVIYLDETVDETRNKLLTFDGVLVWVDPIAFGEDRTKLDAMLRDVASQGVFVSAHPDVILKMGTKEVIFRTRHFGWGTDTHLYRTIREFRSQFPARLKAAGPRVLKQYRGNGGNGVWKVELISSAAGIPDDSALVRVLHARRDSQEEELGLGDFMRRCEEYFAGDGRLIDQAFQSRLPEGMIRCYVSQGEVVGFGHQLIKALIPPPPKSAGPEAAQPGPRIMSAASNPQFAVLRAKLEAEWVPAMMQLLDIEQASLPVIWDADFLYGPKTPSGEDTYVLCEINVSAVFPFPEQAAAKIAETGARLTRAAKALRGAVR